MAYCEQLCRVPTAPSEEEEGEKLEWKRSFTSLHVNPLRKEAARERIALEWDCSGKGGVAKYVVLDEEQVYSLRGHVGEERSDEG